MGEGFKDVSEDEVVARLKRSTVPPTFQGVLKKKGGGNMHGGWKDRYFKLYKTKMLYFTNASCSEVRGLFDMSGGSVTAIKHTSFTIQGPMMQRQDVRLDAGDIQTLEKWLGKLGEVGVKVPFEFKKSADPAGGGGSILPPWQCPRCKVVNLGEHPKCASCKTKKAGHGASTRLDTDSPPPPPAHGGYTSSPPAHVPYADAPPPPPSPPVANYSHVPLADAPPIVFVADDPPPPPPAPVTTYPVVADSPPPAAPSTIAPVSPPAYTPQYVGGYLVAE